SGHSWFSARMVGLPFIGTVGACAGKMVAVASPNDMRRKYNWARVLKHEFTHVVNLQQTDFTIPRWFTEALAVRQEGYPHPLIWDRVLARRAAAGTLFNLDTINLGFVRPVNGDDWPLAYCQAELYAEYMAETYGKDALNRMIAAYALRARPRHGLAAYVMARGQVAAGDTLGAMKLLQGTLDPGAPGERALALLAKMTLDRGDSAEAVRLYQIGADHFTHAPEWS